MASYISGNQSRETVTIMMSKAEAEAINKLAELAWDEGLGDMNPQSIAAADRAMKAISASTNRSARRAGFFDT